ncbi:Qat anti-phage system TatD family nuclease QatD [Flavihumibacter sp. CACIAM 22H1]|uniref:Qat anti-phage system TatD family nuclease QatD n=1 Tax=Flavihumibacter sp. CACIAM 22H1 TaxID=1812911 RepID=UPI0007A91134|nr:Qat anti-phage system TatD family nuclease QatD [Flavihumibacter sp. CACIAM 22H1]KYP13029.1 MAG: deoxyribonuclease [Flavihumibacter sp. CACIAM 22H1]
MLDTHCHIDLYSKPESILNECDKYGYTILSMTNLPSHFERGIPFFQNRNKVRQALGMHPLHTAHHKKEFPKFISNLEKTSYIGEVGLDFSKEGFDTKDIQVHTFEKILEIVSDKKKLLSIHSRLAERKVLELLRKYKIKNVIFHWYSGDINLIDEIVQQGYYFSINPAMVKSMSGKKIISKVPRNFILTETDGPFVMENDLPIRPGHVQPVVDFLATEWMLKNDEVKQIIWSNFQKVVKKLK